MTSYLVHLGGGGSLGSVAHRPSEQLFSASAFKTFTLAQYLREVEAGLLSEQELVAINDDVRDLGRPVFIALTGRPTGRAVLEAMITHSDNTATNATMSRVGIDRVRGLVAAAGLRFIRIPDSTRIFLSHVLGAPSGVDFGWPGVLEAIKNPPGPLRPLLNDQQTLAGSAQDFVSWYEQALQGNIFAKAETLAEFKRIHAMAIQIGRAVPENTLAYAKGGEVSSYHGFNAESFAGQMMVDRTPVTFCFLVNWTGPESEFPVVETEYFAAIKEILRIIKRGLR